MEICFFNSFKKDEWDKIVIEFDGSIYYSYWMINYILVFNENKKINNYSFLITENNQFLAIVPLFIEEINNLKQFSMGENPVFSPLFNSKLTQKEKLKLYEKIDNYIEEIARDLNCKLARFQIPSYNFENINYYKLFGYSGKIKNPDWYIFKCDFTYILNLKNKELPELRANIRKSFKSLVNKTERDTKLIILDKNSNDREVFDKYVNTHYKIKGKNRSLEAFEEDYNALCSGLQTILISEYENKYIGVVVLYTFNKKAIYNSAMQDYSFEKIYPNHFLMWKSIEYLKNNDYEYFYNGEQVIENKDNVVTKKEKDLSYFKQAWGGELYPWYKAEKVFYE